VLKIHCSYFSLSKQDPRTEANKGSEVGIAKSEQSWTTDRISIKGIRNKSKQTMELGEIYHRSGSFET